MKKRLMILMTVFIIVGVSGAAEMYGNSNSANKVLIAKEDTGYKKRLVRELVSRLENEGDISITVVDHRKGGLSDVNPSDYNAVFITNSGAQAKVRPDVMVWLEIHSNNDDNVILHTTQITDWDPPVEVDSITSASQNSNIDQMSDDIMQRIRVFLQDE
jgi:hypothetical protein